MADRLVDLEGHLLGADDEVGRVVAGALGRGQQRAGFLGDPGGVARQVQLAHQLPAARAVLATNAGVAAALRLVVTVGGGVHARAALADALVDPMALAAHQPLGGVPDVVARVGDIGPVLAHGSRQVDEQVALLRQRHRQRVLVDGVFPVVLPDVDRRQLQVGAWNRCAGARDRGRLRAGRLGCLAGQIRSREEAPA